VLAVGAARARASARLPRLLIGSGLIGIAIGIVNVLLPVLIKKDFSGLAGSDDGVYTMAFIGRRRHSPPADGAAQQADGRLLVFRRSPSGLVPVVLAMVVWMPRLTGGAGSEPLGSRVALQGIWTNALAWQVTFVLMGLQSALGLLRLRLGSRRSCANRGYERRQRRRPGLGLHHSARSSPHW
jgi:CP family cyanate transporter-like MFS transporter